MVFTLVTATSSRSRSPFAKVRVRRSPNSNSSGSDFLPPRHVSVDRDKLTDDDHKALDVKVLKAFRYHLEFNKEPDWD